MRKPKPLIFNNYTATEKNWSQIRRKFPFNPKLVSFCRNAWFLAAIKDKAVVPLFLANGVVVLPIGGLSGGLGFGEVPIPDPLQHAINPLRTVPEADMEAAFQFFPGAVRFAILFSGNLQVFFPSTDLENPNLPTEFGGLTVIVIEEGCRPSPSDPQLTEQHAEASESKFTKARIVHAGNALNLGGGLLSTTTTPRYFRSDDVFRDHIPRPITICSSWCRSYYKG